MRVISQCPPLFFAIVGMSTLILFRSLTDDARSLAVSAAFFCAIVRMSTLRLFRSFTGDARDLPVSAAFFFFFFRNRMLGAKRMGGVKRTGGAKRMGIEIKQYHLKSDTYWKTM
jgi:hypothetical protein